MKNPASQILIAFLFLTFFVTSEASANLNSGTTTDTLRSKYTMGEFIGTNSFIDSPVDRLAPVGWIREYHNWGWNEIENDVFEYNRWNGFWNFDQFYTDLKAAGIMVCPVVWGSPSWLQPAHNDRPVVSIEAANIPNSYREIAELMYQYAARYGSVKVDESKLIVNDGQTIKSGLGLVSYIEDWNEQDKDWEGESAYFSPSQYAAMASANIDGHCGTMGPLYGMKQADPDMKFVMGGLVSYDTKYLKDMKTWFVNNRPDSAWPVDVINFHHYAFKRDETGVSPEENYFKQRVESVVKWRNLNAPESEVWLTEFGYDSNPYSMNRAPEIGSFSQEEVQAIWNIRTFLIVSSTGLDRAAHYMIRDTGGSEYRYGDSGLTTSPEEGHQKKVSWYYLYTMKAILNDLNFIEVIREDDEAWIYKYDKPSGDTAVYACWSPTSEGLTQKITFLTDIPTNQLKITRLADKSITGNSKVIEYRKEGVSITISESPIFVEVIKDTSSADTPSLPGKGANWTIATISMGKYRSNKTLQIERDTLINDMSYHCIFQTNDSIYDTSNATYLCAVREGDKKWYFIPEGDSIDFLLYNYDVQIGDTVHINNPWGSASELIVFETDSILLGDKYYKTINLGHYDKPSGYPYITENWIEGIGSTKGLIYSGIFLFDYGHSLLCFHNNDSLVYMNSPDNSCGYISVSSSQKNAGSQLKIYPNPANDIIFIDARNSCITEIFDLNGKLRLHTINHKIDVSNLEPGIYIIKCTNQLGNILTIEKLMINRNKLQPAG